MDYQRQLMAKFTTFLPFLKKLYPHDCQLPTAAAAAAFYDGAPQSSGYCAICLNDICGGDSYRKLAECRHCFHADCIDAWLKSHSTCPLCRTQLPQMISLNDDHRFSALISNIVLLFHSFVEKMCNPLNDELSSMLCAASLR